MKIGLYDEAFAHVDPKNHGMAGVEPSFFSWERSIPHEISVFTEDYIYVDGIEKSESKYNVGWLIETREICPRRYENFNYVNSNLDFIMTHDHNLLRKFPEKTRFAPFGGCWIKRDKRKFGKKNQLISSIFSKKNFMPGHNIRHETFRLFGDDIDFYGEGCGRHIRKKDESIENHMFSLVIENSRCKNYFTEKIIDCFAYGTVPVYWGCTNIGDFFNDKGIIAFNEVGDLNNILASLDGGLYASMRNHAIENFYKSFLYDVPEDWIFRNVFSKIL
tara:strand:+ start:552 stop:1376 length:825 start_codon:yes stop_codon:yes gene_type:complete